MREQFKSGGGSEASKPLTGLSLIALLRAAWQDKGRAFILKEGEDSVGEGVPFLLMKEKPDR